MISSDTVQVEGNPHSFTGPGEVTERDLEGHLLPSRVPDEKHRILHEQ